MAFLVVEKGNGVEVGKKFPLGESTVLIGRKTGENNPDICLNDEFVSRNHAEICFEAPGYKIRDLNSTNGTALDGMRIAPGKFYPLKDNLAIGLGINSGVIRVMLRFKESISVPTTRLVDADMPELVTLSWIRIGENLGEIWVDGKAISLPKKEYDFILCLHNRAGKVCTREELIQEVWPEVLDSSGVSDAAIDQLVHRIRLKIERYPSHPERLVSKKGFGYMIM